MVNEDIFIDQLREGMILGKDIYDQYGSLILPKHSILTKNTIVKMNNHQIKQVSIIYPEEFKKFEETVLQSVNHLKESLNDIILKNEKIDVQELIKEIEDIEKQSKNSMHIFDMLQLMRGYDDATYIHCVNVALICSMMGRWLNFPKEEIQVLTVCGLLHDIGKLMIPEEIIKKPSNLSKNEFAIVKMHPSLGYEILKDEKLDKRIIQAVYAHHERCDGKGYPRGLKEEDLDDFTKIVTIADVYDAMTSNRVYRGGICPFDVIEEFRIEGFQKYDVRYLLIFLERVVETYINKRVRLSNNKQGRIVMINRQMLSRPVVRVGDMYIDLSKNYNLKIESILF